MSLQEAVPCSYQPVVGGAVDAVGRPYGEGVVVRWGPAAVSPPNQGWGLKAIRER